MLHLSGTEWLVYRLVYTVSAIVAIICVASNFCLFLVTIRTKSLRSNCHILIGLCAVFDCCHQVSRNHPFVLIYAAHYCHFLYICPLQVMPIIGLFGGCACMMLIGFERLIAVAFPAQYRTRGRRFLIVSEVEIEGNMEYCSRAYLSTTQEKTQICAVPAVFHGKAAIYFANTLGPVTLTTIGVYCTVALIISRRSSISAATRKAFRSNFFVMSADVSGWTVAMIGVQFINAFITSADDYRFIATNGCGYFINSGIAAKSLIYYSTSAEYRQAFRFAFR
ncbi:hypothetical protein PMAYCL1PPCAC_16832, partial [Pristionchus mayeri]